MRVFITRPIPQQGIAQLEKAGFEVLVGTQPGPIEREELLNRAAGADGIITMLTEKVDGEFFERCPTVRVVANYAVGYNNIDIDAATRHGVAVTNTPDVLTDATADLAWALMLGAARRLAEGDRLVQSGTWTGWEPLQLLGYGVAGKTLGIVGPGRIGRGVARRGLGFRMRVLYYGRRRNDAMETECGGKFVDLDTLLAESDFVSLNCPLTAQTQHLIGRDQFRRMKKNAILVNTARGPVVDEAALVEALEAGEIAGAGLDVFEEEPAVQPGLLARGDVVMAPHIGSATHEARGAMAELCAENIEAFLAGRKPPTLLNPDVMKA